MNDDQVVLDVEFAHVGHQITLGPQCSLQELSCLLLVLPQCRVLEQLRPVYSLFRFSFQHLPYQTLRQFRYPVNVFGEGDFSLVYYLHKLLYVNSVIRRSIWPLMYFP